MGLMDRIKKVTGTNDAYDEAYDDDYYGGFDGYNEGEDDSDMQMAGGMNPSMGGMGIPSQSAAPAMGGGLSLSGNNIKMQVVRPQSFDSVSQIADHLLNKCTVVLNLEQTNKETSRRLIDFLSGVAYSIGGNLKRIAVNAYVVTPANVDVDEAKIKPTPRRTEPQPEAKEPANEDFSDFN